MRPERERKNGATALLRSNRQISQRSELIAKFLSERGRRKERRRGRKEEEGRAHVGRQSPQAVRDLSICRSVWYRLLPLCQPCCRYGRLGGRSQLGFCPSRRWPWPFFPPSEQGASTAQLLASRQAVPQRLRQARELKSLRWP